jgi:hypothetical protein
MTFRWDETWHRLRDWTNGQAQSERLAAQVLLSDGYERLEPSHPLGGKDAGKDAIAVKDGKTWLIAVYFPHGGKGFAQIRKKFLADLRGVTANSADAFAFVTNQKLTLRQREALRAEAGATPVDLYHLERITAILDRPPMVGVRKQFLQIDFIGEEVLQEIERLRAESRAQHEQLVGLQTGGDSFCYWMLYHFDTVGNIAKNFVLIHVGDFPLYDVRLRICDMDAGRDVLLKDWGEINGPAEFLLVKWPLRPAIYYRIFFHARNGMWHQDLQLRRSKLSECWLTATRVLGGRGEMRFSRLDNGFVAEFGEPTWRG